MISIPQMRKLSLRTVLPKTTKGWDLKAELIPKRSPSSAPGRKPGQMLTLVSTHQLLGHTLDLNVAKGLELVHLPCSDGVLPHGGVHRRAEEQGLAGVPGPDDTGLWRGAKVGVGGMLQLCLPTLPSPSTSYPLSPESQPTVGLG